MAFRRCWRKRCVFTGVTAFLVLTWIFLLLRVDTALLTEEKKQAKILRSFRSLSSSQLSNKKLLDVKTKLSELAMEVHRAKIHARGTKTSDHLGSALVHLDYLLDILDIDKDVLFKRYETESTSVCPEKYMGSTHGYPFFYKGFDETNCSFGKPIRELVTVISIDDLLADKSGTHADRFVNSVLSVYPDIPLIVATHRKDQFANVMRRHPSISVVLNKGKPDGELFNEMVRDVKTEYVLVGKMVDFLTNDSRLGRLVREMERMEVSVVAGAWRDPRGHWSHGCYQTAYRNFTLKYVYGYDESMHDCVFCDHVTGPFVTTTNTLRRYPFNKNYDLNGGLFEDWFLRLKHSNMETIACPDSMFHIRKTQHSSSTQLKEFMRNMKLYRLHTVDGKEIRGSCHNEQVQNSKCLSPCSSNENAEIVKFIMSVCEKSNMFCELQEGTALGAVKFGKVLPWERDGDITFLSGNYTAFQKLEPQFADKQYKLNDLASQWCCADNRTAGGKFVVASAGWTIELYGQHMMDSEILVFKGLSPTKVSLDGQWVNVPRNPGLFVRNRYGPEIYQHALHWLSTGKQSGWEPYKTNVFMKCSTPGSHDCLDRYNADGSLSFEYILP